MENDCSKSNEFDFKHFEYLGILLYNSGLKKIEFKESEFKKFDLNLYMIYSS